MVLRLPIWQPSSMKIKRLPNLPVFILEVHSCEMGQWQAVVLHHRSARQELPPPLPHLQPHASLQRSQNYRSLPSQGLLSATHTLSFIISSELCEITRQACASLLTTVLFERPLSLGVFAPGWARREGSHHPTPERSQLPEGWPLNSPSLGLQRASHMLMSNVCIFTMLGANVYK